VLDEADRMLDIGFEKDLNLIIQTVKEVNPSVQISLFSATIPSWVRSTVGRSFSLKVYLIFSS
jgi:superfamily II DNA/RNA helicase